MDPAEIKNLPTLVQRLIQIGLKTEGFYSGTTRGVAGPKTIEALTEYLQRKTSSSGSQTSKTFGEILLRVAKEKVGVREHGGNNTGTWVRAFQSATWLTGTGWAWCAAFVCWCVREAIKTYPVPGMKRPLTAAAWDFETWAKSRAKSDRVKLYKPVSRSMTLRPGDIVVFTFSHIGIVDQDLGDRFTTIEGNTNRAGSREGDGVYCKNRLDQQIRSIIRIL